MPTRDDNLAPSFADDSDRSDADGIDGFMGFHIGLAQGASFRRFAENCAELELTQKQIALMWLISDHPGVSQIDLGQRMRMDRASTMSIINRLQARGFLRREKSPSDGRKQALFLEPAGASMLVKAREALREHEQWLRSHFTASETRILIDLLARIHG